MKKNLLTFAFLFIILSFSSHASTFQKTFGFSPGGDAGSSVIQTFDGNFVIAGFSYGPLGNNEEIFLVKITSSGDTLWTKSYGGLNIDKANSISETTDHGLIITGVSSSFGSGGGDVFLMRTSSSGDTLWTKTFGGFLDTEEGWSVRQTKEGGFAIAGVTITYGAGLDDAYLIKTDVNGTLQWTKTYGGFNHENVYWMEQTSDSGYIMTGTCRSFGSSFDVYLIRTKSNGDTIWTKSYGGAGDDGGFSVKQTPDSGFLTLGYTASFGVGYDFYLFKTDKNGDVQWSKTYGGPGYDYGYSIQNTHDGGYILSGYYVVPSIGADLYLVRINSTGDTLWTKTYGGPSDDRGFDAIETSDHGFVAVGYTASYGFGNGDMYVISTDSTGNSDCNQFNPAAVVTPVTSTVIAATSTVMSGGVQANVSPTVQRGTFVSTQCNSIGIDELLEDAVISSVYPNPSDGNFVFELVSEKIFTGKIVLMNALGAEQKIRIPETTLFKTGNNKIRVETKDLSAGIYFLKISAEGKSLTQKVIIN